MYAPETVLELKEPSFIDDDGKKRPLSEFAGKKDEEPRLFPYNRVKVIGPSPIGHSNDGWQGSDAHGVVIQPLSEFAANLDEPYGRLVRMYDVAEEPEDDIARNVVASDRGFNQIPASKRHAPTPEEILRGERVPDEPVAGPSGNVLRGSPLDELDPGEPSAASPLD